MDNRFSKDIPKNKDLNIFIKYEFLLKINTF